MSSVAPDQRFRRNEPCPICGGWATQRRGQGSRCWGFISADNTYAHCVRPEYSGTLQPYRDGSFAHRLDGECRCGLVHGQVQVVVREVREDDRRDFDAAEAARRIWSESHTTAGTPVERYLRRRGLAGPIPETLRFHRSLKHRSGGYWPALVAAVSVWPARQPVAVHRTYLTDDGAKAPVEPNKMALGAIKHGAVRLGRPDARLVVAEGIEDALTVQCATGMAAWAVLGAHNLPNLIVPDDVTDILIGADADEEGLSYARRAAQVWLAERRRVRIATPPAGFKDWNAVRQKEVFECSQGFLEGSNPTKDCVRP